MTAQLTTFKYEDVITLNVSDVKSSLGFIVNKELDVITCSLRIRDLMMKLLENSDLEILEQLILLILNHQNGYCLLNEFYYGIWSRKDYQARYDKILDRNDIKLPNILGKIDLNDKYADDYIDRIGIRKHSKFNDESDIFVDKDSEIYNKAYMSNGLADSHNASEVYRKHLNSKHNGLNNNTVSENYERYLNSKKLDNGRNALETGKRHINTNLLDDFKQEDIEQAIALSVTSYVAPETFVDNLTTEDIQLFKCEVEYFSTKDEISYIDDLDIELWTDFLPKLTGSDYQLLEKRLKYNLNCAVGYNKVKVLYAIAEAVTILEDYMLLDVLSNLWVKVEIKPEFVDLPMSVRLVEMFG